MAVNPSESFRQYYCSLDRVVNPLTQHDFWSGVGCSAYNTFRVWNLFGALLGGSVEI